MPPSATPSPRDLIAGERGHPAALNPHAIIRTQLSPSLGVFVVKVMVSFSALGNATTPKGVRNKVHQVHHFRFTDKKAFQIGRLFVLFRVLYLLHG